MVSEPYDNSGAYVALDWSVWYLSRQTGNEQRTCPGFLCSEGATESVEVTF